MSTIIQQKSTADTTRPVLTETAEEDVFVTDFSGVGLAGVAAVTFAGPGIGLKVVVDERLSPVVRSDAINAVLERLFASPQPRQFALLEISDLSGGVA